MNLDEDGFGSFSLALPSLLTDELCAGVFVAERAGSRCLLDVGAVATAAKAVREALSDAGYLTRAAVAIQAIAFNKTPTTNWKVPWHQDVLFPFAEKVTAAGYDLACVKDGVDFARPPLAVLASMLAVRVHLDDCGADNGALRVAPGSHRLGILKGADIANSVSVCGERVCSAMAGVALLMKPLLLHASSPAASPSHRRVLHLVYYDGPPVAERWHRVV